MRAHGGRNLRENSSALLDGDVLVDLNMTTFPQAARFGLDIRGARVLLVTHAHEDHFAPMRLYWRRMPEGADALRAERQRDVGAPRFTPLPPLHIVGPRYALEKLRAGEGYGGYFYLSHLSPHWAPPHDVYAPMMAEEGMTVAYDGLSVEV